MRQFFCFIFILVFSSPLAAQTYYGSWKIDDTPVFYANTHDPSTGACTDTAPTWRVYENEVSTALLNGTMTLLDSGNTCGFYSEQITLSAANGFESGKSYAFYIEATVGVAFSKSFVFQVEAAVKVNSTVTGALTSSSFAAGAVDASAIAANAIGASEVADGAIDAGAVAADALTAAKFASDVATEFQTGLYHLKQNTATATDRIKFFAYDTNGAVTKNASSVTCQVSVDGAAPTTVTDAPVEVEFTTGAFWKFGLTQAETNGQQAMLMCTGTGLADTPLMIEFQH